jgi:hypothetical protein
MQDLDGEIAMIGLALALMLQVRDVPLASPGYAWSKPGVAQAEFEADLAACGAVYREALPPAAVRSYFGSSSLTSNGLNTYSGTEIYDEPAVEAWDACFEARGYLGTGLSGPEVRQIYGRYITDDQRRERLYAIAIDAGRRRAPPREPMPQATPINPSEVTPH